MLTRIRFRRDYRVYARFLSDKPSEGDAKLPESKTRPVKNKKKDDTDSITNTEKIQILLKNMMIESKIKESEYRERFASAPDVPRRRKQHADEIEVKTEQIEESLTQAAGQVAEAIGGDVKQTEAELLSRVLGKINQTAPSLGDLISGMKVDRTKDSDELKPETRGQQVKRFVARAQAGQPGGAVRRESYRPQPREARSVHQVTTVDIFAEQPLGVYRSPPRGRGPRLAVWEGLQRRELALATAQPPGNYFQKMASWTQQGKVWRFPINNEQGLEEEEAVHFSEHIFLESHLESWCPARGPIRHYMELVCVGLAKNPFYTVREKRDHILWYKDYFEAKKSILLEVGAWDNAAGIKPEASA